MNHCRIEQEGDCYKILGLLNYETVTHIYKAGVELLKHVDRVRFDFAHVSHADSSAIALLLSWLRLAKKDNKSLVFVNFPLQLIETANVYEVMPLLKSYLSDAGSNITKRIN